MLVRINSRTAMLFVLLAVLTAICAVSVLAGGGGSKAGLSIYIKGMDGWDDQTSGEVTLQIDPFFYSEGESNVRFEAKPHSEYLSSIFLVADQKNWRRAGAFSTVSHPCQSKVMRWSGVIAIGVKESRKCIEVRPSDFSWPQRFAWDLSIYNPSGAKMDKTLVTYPGGYTEEVYVLPAMPGSTYTFTATATLQ